MSEKTESALSRGLCPDCLHPIAIHPPHGTCLAIVGNGCCGCRLSKWSTDAAAELAQLKKQVEQANWFRTVIEQTDLGKTIIQLRAELDEARKSMEEIAIGQGAFNRDPLIHASNVIEHSKEIASAFLKAHPEETK